MPSVTNPRAGSIVLVPGGFLGAWIFDDVVRHLGEVGVRAHALELTSVGEASKDLGDLHSDVGSVRAFLDGLEYPVVLCGHSYGGAVVTEAGAGPHPAVAHLVYLTAAVPAAGSSMAGLAAASADRSPPPGPASQEAVVVRDDGSAVLVAEQARWSLFGDCEADRASAALERLRSFNLAVGTHPISAAAWLDVPSTYVRCSRDPLPELVAEDFLKRATTKVVEMPTGHCPQWSRPDLVTRLLVDCLMAV